ncbi:hypothetical protein LEP48_08970 [Isoptericola sp. NEAU-Y5]|uniref:Uncharacterized protein n=1 Tax=Isoptericola luteus TaxID=2879484 RepID=A0ABS7ZG41_9MICO|nr:hypothetical protein [Isoptericola sp. NEAU-Y5]
MYDEYGNTFTVNAPTSGAVNYAWLGAKERATNANTKLILMGARLYSSATGQFSSTDPVRDGNTTAYTYPQDSINYHDLTGTQWQCMCGRSSTYWIPTRVNRGATKSKNYKANPGPRKSNSSGARLTSNSTFSRTYGKNVADIKGQARRYVRQMRSKGYRASVPNVRYGEYGHWADFTVRVYDKRGKVVHTRHFVTLRSYR